MTGLLAVSGISSQMNTNAGPENQAQPQTPSPDQTVQSQTAPTPAPEPIYNGGVLPEVVVTAPAPEQTYDGGALPEVVVTAPAPEHTPQPEAPIISREDLPRLQPLPEIRRLSPNLLCRKFARRRIKGRSMLKKIPLFPILKWFHRRPTPSVWIFPTITT